jgi:hypothetical protein
MTSQKRYPAARMILLALAIPLLFSACSMTKQIDSWRSDDPPKRKPQKVAVIAVLPDALMREAVEVDAAKILVKKGTPAVAASKIPGMSGGIRGEIDPEVATGILRKADVDGVIVMFYAGGGRKDYARSQVWVDYVGTARNYNWAYPYFTGSTRVYSVVAGPGYTEFATTAYVETSYYDLMTEKPAWRLVTFTKDVEHTDTVSDIANDVAREMRSTGLAK